MCFINSLSGRTSHQGELLSARSQGLGSDAVVIPIHYSDVYFLIYVTLIVLKEVVKCSKQSRKVVNLSSKSGAWVKLWKNWQ